MSADVSRVIERMLEEFAASNARRNAALTKANELKARAAEFDSAVAHEDGIVAEIRRALAFFGIDPQEG